MENGTPQPNGIDAKSAKVKDAIMKEPDMEPKQPSDLGKQYHSYIHAIILLHHLFYCIWELSSFENTFLYSSAGSSPRWF